MITTVWAFIFVAPLTHILASDILLVPEHSLGGLSYEYRDSSIISGAQLSAELDYVDFTAEQPISLDPEGATYFCTDCPCAVVDDSSDKGYRWISDASNTLDLLWSVENNVLNLNHHALLDNEMNDLHLPQTTRQTNVVEDTGVSSDTYTGELPIKYSVKVVQTTTVEWEDASILNSAGVQQGDVVQFYSVDFEILKIDDQDFHDLDIRKINVHVVRREDGVLAKLPFTGDIDKDPSLDAVSTPDFTDQGSSSASNGTLQGGNTTVRLSPSASPITGSSSRVETCLPISLLLFAGLSCYFSYIPQIV